MPPAATRTRTGGPHACWGGFRVSTTPLGDVEDKRDACESAFRGGSSVWVILRRSPHLMSPGRNAHPHVRGRGSRSDSPGCADQVPGQEITVAADALQECHAAVQAATEGSWQRGQRRPWPGSPRRWTVPARSPQLLRELHRRLARFAGRWANPSPAPEPWPHRPAHRSRSRRAQGVPMTERRMTFSVHISVQSRRDSFSEVARTDLEVETLFGRCWQPGRTSTTRRRTWWNVRPTARRRCPTTRSSSTLTLPPSWALLPTPAPNRKGGRGSAFPTRRTRRRSCTRTSVRGTGFRLMP
ncbi:hypothetical protein SAMN05444320_105413 [Streptoalloteichus hindustanus]|uniref:Uncharacterized protein n=1 Tax=Streptoalloteichus hindustanus TaxID=2017 RepID=A0A1M5FF34_STRHI|nr:hypothetical protein SAMN05444320_105413 [Streptoalloteichus hindustanus]